MTFSLALLVEEFDSLHPLKPLVPALQTLHPVKRPIVAPMTILFRDEKYKAETIEIVRQLMLDANLSGNSQVSIYILYYKYVHAWDNNDWQGGLGGGTPSIIFRPPGILKKLN